MDARRFIMNARGLANITLKERIDWYAEEIGGAHPFGKNKKAVLRNQARGHGDLSLHYLDKHPKLPMRTSFMLRSVDFLLMAKLAAIP